MSLALEKDIAIRIFLRGIDDLKFVKLVQRALEGWKIVDPAKTNLGVLLNNESIWRKNPNKNGCCLLGAAFLNRNTVVVDDMILNIDTIAIGSSFDCPSRKHWGLRPQWAAKISEIVFAD